MKVLVACEYSGRVRDAFTRLGHDAVSVDLLPTETEGRHIQGDVLDVLESEQFDLMIAFPPCTHLAVSGARYFEEKRADGRQQSALAFVQSLMDAPVERIALENPVSVISTYIRKPDQYIQPYQFGHGETKKTGLWLKNLPLLRPTDEVEGREPVIHMMPPSANRWMNRSRTYQGIADDMAQQWGQDTEWLKPNLL
mgnify:CR=1 FL=1